MYTGHLTTICGLSHSLTAPAFISCDVTTHVRDKVSWTRVCYSCSVVSFYILPSSIASYCPTCPTCPNLREEPKEQSYLPSVLSFHGCFPSPLHPFILAFLCFFFPFSLPPSLTFCLEPVTIPPAHRHEVTYVTTHKGPSLAAIFSRDGTSEFQRFPRLQVSVLVHFSLLRSTCCYSLCWLFH